MSFSLIQAALMQAYENGAFSLPTAYENRDFKPDHGAPWAEIFIVTNQPSVATLGDAGQDEHTGFMQINLNYPPNTGTQAALAKADEIRAAFPVGTLCSYGGQDVVTRTCGRSGGRLVDGLYRITLTINWYARTSRS